MNFLDKSFLLHNCVSEKLYFEYSEALPIIDYHCHLPPNEIALDKRFSSLTELWLDGDHYKWRAMRGFGIKEFDITGTQEDKVKFLQWAKTLPWCIASPLQHWTHLELQRYFNIKTILNPQNAESIWNECNEQISQKDFSVKNLIKRSNVEIICTTDDPCDDLAHHKQIALDKEFATRVLPTFRPDFLININSGYMKTLGQITHTTIHNWESLQEAISSRVQYFHQMGCRLSDHSIDVSHMSAVEINMDTVLDLVLQNKTVSKEQMASFEFTMLVFLASLYAKYNWTMQLHIGALRDVNPIALQEIGNNAGFDVIGDSGVARGLCDLLGAMQSKDALPKSVLYNLNPKDNFTLAVIAGAFQGSQKFDFGKIQFGSGWWFNDQKDGMLRQITDWANLGVLGKFIGMLTDSRSFLSFPRHEYFRRIFCNFIGELVVNGEYPNDEEMLKQIVQGVSYFNAKEFLQFDN